MYSYMIVCGSMLVFCFFFFFFRQKTADALRISDWSSDVCSSDLLAITGIAVTGLAPGADLRAAAPAREPRGGGPTEEQRMAEQRLNFAFDLGRDIGDHAAHLLDPARARGDRIEVVADRLLARQLRNRAEDRLEEARRAGLVAFGEVDLHARRGVDVNEAAIDRTPGRAFPQRVDRGLEGGVGEHRSVDHRSEEHTSELQSLMRIPYAGL